MNEKSQMITQSTILAMGWTKTMIKNLLPEPTERPNPHYKCAAPMKLWEQDKVLEVMETEDFKNALEKASKRKNAAKSAAKTKVVSDNGEFDYCGHKFAMVKKVLCNTDEPALNDNSISQMGGEE